MLVLKLWKARYNIPEEDTAKQLGWDPGIATWLAGSQLQRISANMDEFESRQHLIDKPHVIHGFQWG